MRFRKVFSAIILVTTLSQLIGVRPLEAKAQPLECGAWQVQTQETDPRLELNIVTQSGKDCRGGFRVSNKTGVSGFGGYGFELSPTASNANAEWMPGGDPDGKNYVIPSLDIEMFATPLDPTQRATVNISAEVNLKSFSIDLSTFLFRTALALIPGPGCLISDEQILFASLRTSSIVENAARLSLKGDFTGARDEIVQVSDEFFSRGEDALKEAGVECGIDLIQSIIKKPLAIVKIGVAYLTWIPVVLFDYFKYPGWFTGIAFQYTPPSPTLKPLDRFDQNSIVEWLNDAIEKKDIAIFKTLAANDIMYVNYIEGGQILSSQEYLADLETRLPSGAHCDAVSIYSSGSTNYLMVWTSGWSPLWEMDEMCYAGCNPITPPWQSDIAAFLLERKSDGWTLSKMWLNNDQIWREVYKASFFSCTELQPENSTEAEPASPFTGFSCDGAPASRLEPGDYAHVSINPPIANRLRNSAGTGGRVIGEIQPGEAVEILSGPVCSDMLVWWEVKVLETGEIGWTAEGYDESYWLIPCSNKNSCGR